MSRNRADGSRLLKPWVVRSAVLSAVALLLPTCAPGQRHTASRVRTPVVLDLDIGGDIDDAFALALLLQSKAVDLQAVTTVTADTHARARIAAKMLAIAGQPTVPVAAGPVLPGDPFPQAKWADGFNSPALVPDSAVDLLHKTIARGHGQTVLIALGPLSNVAALLQLYPADRAMIKQIVLMGGSVNRGYQPGSGPTPEYNIADDAPAAQAVFGSGVPVLMAPLDITAALQLNEPERGELFGRHTPLTEALQQLYTLWGQPTPTLHDPMAVALLLHPAVSQTKPLHIEVGKDGMTRAQAGAKPNAVVGVETDPAAFMRYYESMFQ